jgi:hypothetical protein
MGAARILLVDDEPDIREIAEISLGLDAGFEVRLGHVSLPLSHSEDFAMSADPPSVSPGKG